MSGVLGADVRRLVQRYDVRSARERAVQADFAGFFPGDDGPVSRDDGPRHATASAFAFSPDRRRILLVFHGKGRFWVQPGGHLEPGDVSVADAALRELREETGVVAPSSAVHPVHDLDHHALSSAFGRCASHLDVGIALTVDDQSALAVSEESEDVRWWSLSDLPRDVPPGFADRVSALRSRLEG